VGAGSFIKRHVTAIALINSMTTLLIAMNKLVGPLEISPDGCPYFVDV